MCKNDFLNPINRSNEVKGGRKVLKKRPVRIKIPAKLRQNLQVIPESLNLQPTEIPVSRTTLTPFVHSTTTTVAPETVNFEPQQNGFQEARQPKALTVFSLDETDDDINDDIAHASIGQFDEEAIPQNFSPLFAVPTSETAREQDLS